MNPADYDHLFRTWLGLPPSKDDKPLCGADLPDTWDFAGPRPPCPACEALRAGKTPSQLLDAHHTVVTSEWFLNTCGVCYFTAKKDSSDHWVHDTPTRYVETVTVVGKDHILEVSHLELNLSETTDWIIANEADWPQEGDS